MWAAVGDVSSCGSGRQLGGWESVQYSWEDHSLPRPPSINTTQTVYIIKAVSDREPGGRKQHHSPRTCQHLHHSPAPVTRVVVGAAT